MVSNIEIFSFICNIIGFFDVGEGPIIPNQLMFERGYHDNLFFEEMICFFEEE